MCAKQKSNKISLKQVSELAGVTQCTASRILNRNPKYRYAEKTVERVFKIAKENGYRTSQLYKSLFSGKTKSAGVISSNDGFYTRITRGIHDRLLKSGYATVMGLNSNDFDDPQNSLEKKIIHRLNEHRVDGFIIRPTLDNATDEHFKEIIEMNVPLITIDRKVNSKYADYVGSDNTKGGRLAAQHLLKLGHTNIIQFNGIQTCSAFKERASGFENEIIVQGVIPQSITCENNDDMIKKCELIFSRKDHPTAVFCSSDALAGELYKLLNKFNLKVPDDVSIIGFGDQIFAKYFNPLLTTIDQQPYEIGVKAAELFVERIEEEADKEHQHKEVLVDVKLIKRDSCRAI
jgi:LacI family transcriptional regulator, galactose operon repressor